MIFLMLPLVLTLPNCGQKSQREQVDELIETQVELKIANYKEIRKQKCLEEMYRQAGEIADSILLEQARLARDTANRPVIPIKPEKPQVIDVSDTTPVKPFLPELKDSTVVPIKVDTI